MDPALHIVQQETVYFTRNLLDLAHRLLYTTTLSLRHIFMYPILDIVISRHSSLSTYDS